MDFPFVAFFSLSENIHVFPKTITRKQTKENKHTLNTYRIIKKIIDD